MCAKAAFSPCLGKGPAPQSCNFTEGPKKVSSRAKVTQHLPSEEELFLPLWNHYAALFSWGEGLQRVLGNRDEVGPIKGGMQEPHWDLGCKEGL